MTNLLLDFYEKTLARLVKEKIVAPEEAYLKSVEKEDMLAKLKLLGIDFQPVTQAS